jgi:hypothetical protein
MTREPEGSLFFAFRLARNNLARYVQDKPLYAKKIMKMIHLEQYDEFEWHVPQQFAQPAV